MKKLLGALFVAGLLVGYANAQPPGFRMYFDLAGSVPGNQAEDDAPHPGVTAKINPALVGGGRLYIYWEFGAADQNVFSPNYDIEIDDGSIISAWNYNNTNIGGIGRERWEPLGDPVDDYAVEPWNFPGGPANNPTAVGGNSVSFTSAAILAFGLNNDFAHQGLDNQLAFGDGPFGSTLLGYVDVVEDEPGLLATVWLAIGAQGFAIEGGTGPIFFGFGDGPVDPDHGGRSLIADATINIPEPAGLMLLGLGILALRRRR